MTVFYTLDLLGTTAFAVSGALVAMNKRFDPFGVFIIAFVTAVGGGTLRDVLIGKMPVGWMLNINYVFVIIAATLLAIILRKKLKYLSKSLFLFDTIGLGIFTITGVEIGLSYDFHPIITIALGTMSACFGGVIRDTLCNEIPVIFRKEIYATACIIGALAFIVMSEFNISVNLIYIITTGIIIGIRLIAVKRKLSLPTFYTSGNK